MNRQMTEIDGIFWDIPEDLKNEKEEYLKDKYISFTR